VNDALWGRLTDVPGVRVGQTQRVGEGWRTGVTVVVPPPGTVGSVDVRGGGPGTHETDALDPTTLVPTVDAVTLTGGSAWGLASAHGVQRWCREQGRGYPAGPPDDPRSILVPIVPAAAVFDLGRGGDPTTHPDAEMGYQAAAAAATAFERGAVGAATGARTAMLTRPGGVGTACVRVGGGDPAVLVGAIAVVNAFGSPFDPVTGALYGTAFVPPGLPRPTLRSTVRDDGNPAAAKARVEGQNTTLAVVVTNARLDVAQARRMATAAHDGIARAVSPAHTLVDGDAVFGLATGDVVTPDVPAVLAVQAAAADAVLLAMLDGVLSTGA
jgi:L-aminopeptidase/D-esterase-like protein